MHHLESVYFGFVNLPLHLSSMLTASSQSYAVSVAGCVVHFELQALEFHILCVVNTEGGSRSAAIHFIERSKSVPTRQSWFVPKPMTFLFDSETSGSSLQQPSLIFLSHRVIALVNWPHLVTDNTVIVVCDLDVNHACWPLALTAFSED